MTHLVWPPNSTAVSNAAVDVRNALTELSTVVESVQSEWSNLRAVYSTPDQETVFAAFNKLPEISEALTGLLESAATSLDTYASELQTLENQRDSVYAEMMELEAEAPGSSSTIVNAYNNRVREADETCARALTSLHLDSTTTPGKSGLDPIAVGNLGMGVAGGTLTWHKGALLTFRDSAKIPAAITNPTVPFDSWTKETFQGKTYGVNPKNGLYLPSSAAPAPETPKIPVTQVKATPVPPTWAKNGGKILGVAGGAVTMYSAYSTEYNESIVRNPEYTQDQHVAEAAKRGTVKGGFEVAGAAAGAAVGASWGATIGTAIPVPVVGTVVGGVVGGLVGGLIGGFFGKKSGEKVEEAVFD